MRSGGVTHSKESIDGTGVHPCQTQVGGGPLPPEGPQGPVEPPSSPFYRRLLRGASERGVPVTSRRRTRHLSTTVGTDPRGVAGVTGRRGGSRPKPGSGSWSHRLRSNGHSSLPRSPPRPLGTKSGRDSGPRPGRPLHDRHDFHLLAQHPVCPTPVHRLVRTLVWKQ